MGSKEIVKQAYECFGAGDIEGLAALMHENYVGTINGLMEMSGEYHGFPAFLGGVLAKIPAHWPNFNLTPIGMISEGNTVFVKLKATADDLDAVFGHLWEVKDGKVISFHAFDDTQKLAAASKAQPSQILFSNFSYRKVIQSPAWGLCSFDDTI